MEQHPEILSIDGEFGTELVAVGLIEKEALEDPAVFIRKFGQYLADGGLALFGDQRGIEVDADIGEVREFLFGGGVFLLATERFEHHVFGHRMDKGGEAFDLGSAADVDEDAEESFLADVVDHLARAQLETKTGLEHTREVVHEVGFRVWFLVLQARQIVQIKRRLFHRRPGSLHGTSSPGKSVQGS
jgi:hypothetical protein